jgi:transposase-like protein
MRIEEKEAEIVRVKAASFSPGLESELQERLRTDVVDTVQATLEEALVAEVEVHRNELDGEKPRRSGYYERELRTQYGQIEQLRVPKLRCGNRIREWRILTRYQRYLTDLLDYASYLYVLGLSLRDLQVCLYFLLGNVLSRSAINQVTLRMKTRMEAHRNVAIVATPSIIIVDGVWVDIQYTLDDFKLDRAGHLRQRRKAEERVILAAMAVWPDGSHHLLHYMVTITEDADCWVQFFDEMIGRGLDPQAIKLVVSDGTKGLLDAMQRRFPCAVQQRCITHKVRGMKNHLSFDSLPEQDEEGMPLSIRQAKNLRIYQIQHDAYDIYAAPSLNDAQTRLEAFVDKWQPIEPDAVRNFKWGGKRTFEFYRFPPELHSHIRTTNSIERFFREFRTKSNEIGAFPNEQSCLTLFFMVLQLEHAKHGRQFVAHNP